MGEFVSITTFFRVLQSTTYGPNPAREAIPSCRKDILSIMTK